MLSTLLCLCFATHFITPGFTRRLSAYVAWLMEQVEGKPGDPGVGLLDAPDSKHGRK